MENQNQNPTPIQKKNPHKHLIIALSIIGVAVLVALIIAVGAIVSDINNQINGKNTVELYEDFESAVLNENNYKYVIEREGRGALFTDQGDEAVKAVIKVVEEVMVDGDDFYYSQTLTTTQKAPNSSDAITATQTFKLTVIDGTKYYYSLGTNDSAPIMVKSTSSSADFEQVEAAVKSIVWKYDKLFKKSDIVEKDGGYRVEMNKDLALDDPALKNALRANAETFFESYARSDVYPYLNMGLNAFEEYDYVVTYDESGRPISVVYDYLMGNGNLFAGDLSVTAEFEYGNASVEAPENADDYILPTN